MLLVGLYIINCPTCSTIFSSTETDPQLRTVSSVTSLKSFTSKLDCPARANFLCHPSFLIYNLLMCESAILDHRLQLLRKTCPEEIIFSKVSYIEAKFPSCHSIVFLILKRYIESYACIVLLNLCVKLQMIQSVNYVVNQLHDLF